jgi:integrase
MAVHSPTCGQETTSVNFADVIDPAPLATDFSFIRSFLTHASAVHGVDALAQQVRLARVALTPPGLIGKAKERDRRPASDEIDQLIEYFEANPRQYTPIARIIRFAIATGMRLDEIYRIEWDDVDMKGRVVKV